MTHAYLWALAALTVAACAGPGGNAPAPLLVREEARPPPSAAQREAFGPLADLVGQTWRSEPAGEGAAGPGDIARWNWDLGGRVIVSRHALEDGSYGGVTYIYRNAASGMLDYVYVTSAGFHTSGSYQMAEDGSWTAEEDVSGHPRVTKVRSTAQILSDGRLRVRSEYFTDGEWAAGRDVIYVPAEAEIPAITGALAE
jgi:hypothetical protein